MKHPARILKHISFKLLAFSFLKGKKFSLRKTLQAGQFKKKYIHLKYKLFLLDRKILCHPVLRYIYPQPGFARRLVAGMLAFIVFGTGLVVYFQPGKADAVWYSEIWRYRKTITIDNANVPNTNQTRFAVLVSLSSDAHLAANAQSDGDDILFTSSDGSEKLSHELQKYDSGTGELSVWVKVPTVSTSEDTTIYMYYGNPSAISQEDSANVWDSSYDAVFHIDEGSGTTVADSTPMLNTTLTMNTSGWNTSGKIVTAYENDAAGFMVTKNGVPAAADDSDFDYTGSENFSISFWLKTDTATNPGANQVILNKQNAANAAGYQIYANTSGQICFLTDDGGGGTVADTACTATDYYDAQWHHIYARKTGTTEIRVYVDGSSAASDTSISSTGTLANSEPLYVGGYASFNIDGDIDELKFARTARSADWIATEYNNQNTPSSFFSSGSVQSNRTAAPLLHWSFDEGRGITAGDASLHENSGVVDGATWQDKSACLFDGRCLKFTDNSATSIFSDGFETGNFSNWTGSSGSIATSTENPLDGVYSTKITMSGTESYANKTISNTTSAYMRGYVNVSSASTSFDMYSLSNSLGNTFNLYYNGGFLCIWNGVTSTETCSTRTIPLGEWHKYELYVVVSASAGQLKAYYDGVLVPDLNLTGQNTGSSSINEIFLGDGNAGRTATYYIDNFSVDSAAFTHVKRSYSSDTELDPGTGSFTVSAWFKHPASVSSFDILLARSDDAAWGAGYKIYMNSSGKVCFGIDDDTSSFPDKDACSTSTYLDSYWHHVVGVKNGTSSITLYIDGKQVDQDGTIATVGNLSGTSATFYVGLDGDGASNPWNGFIDEVKYFDYAKTADQVKAEYNAKGSVLGASAVFGAGDAANSVNQGLVGYWKMDDGVNFPCPSGVNKACDSSGNGYDGTWTGNTASSSGKFGYATTYDGNGDRVEVTGLLGSPTTITLSTWVNLTAFDTSGANFISLGDYVVLGADSGAVFGTYYNGSSWNGTQYLTNIDDTGWRHLVYVIDRANNKQRLYIDGALVSTTTYTDAISYSGLGSNTRLGAHGNGDTTNDLTGKLDESRVYNRAFSDREVRSLYEWAPTPLAHWKLDDKTGTIAYDSTGNGNAGMLSGGLSWYGGKYGGATIFDGVDDMINAGSASNLDDVPASGMTIEAWIKPESLGENSLGRILEKVGSTTPTNGWQLYLQGTNTIAFEADFSGASNLFDYTADNSFSYNEWNHVAVTWDGSTSHSNVTIYVNGIPSQGSSPTNGAGNRVTDAAQSFIIGNNSTGARTFNGAIDDVRVYNYIRTAKQVVQDMNGGHPAVGSPIASALGHWKFDEGRGNAASNSGFLEDSAVGGITSMATPPTGSSGWTSHGRYGKALLFDGTDDFVNVDNVASSIQSGDVTVSGWFKVRSRFSSSSPAIQCIFCLSTSSSTNDVNLRLNNSNGSLEFRVTDSGGTARSAPSSQTSWAQEEWHHAVGTFSSTGGIKIYVDGKLAGVNASTTRGSTVSTVAKIGKRYDGQGFAGTIDDVKVYNYALNADQVAVEYNQGKAVVLGALSTAPDGSATNSASRYYCPPGDSSVNCASGSEPSPVGEWKFDERTGTTANDASGNGGNGTITGSTWVPGKIGYGLNLDGNDDQVDIADQDYFSPSANDVTIEFWARIPVPSSANTSGACGSTGSYLLAKGTTSNFEWGFENDNNNLFCFQLWQSGGATHGQISQSRTMNDGKWHHYVAVVDYLNSLTVYIDGVPIGTETSFSGTMTNGTQGVQVGRRGTGNFATEDVDQLRIFNYARTPAQVAWSYNRGRPTSWWKFDECSGTTLYDSAWTASGSATRVNGILSNGTAGTCSDSGSTWYDGSSGKFNSSLDFDGSNNAVEIKNDEKIWFQKGLKNGFTISTWVYAGSDGEGDAGQIFNKGSTTFCRTENQVGSNLDLECSLDLATTDATITVGNAFTINGWHNVVLSWTDDSDDEVSVWIDGKLRGTSNNGVGPPATENNSLIIGASSAAGATAFDGKIDEVMIFPYEMNSITIKTLYNQFSAVRFGP